MTLSRRDFLRFSGAAAVTSTAVPLFGDQPKPVFTLSKDVTQRISGWGCFPGWVAWGESIGTNKVLQDAIYRDLGMTVVRIPVMPEYGNPDGSLNAQAIDKYLVGQIQTLRDYGIKQWIVTTWSPPAYMKTIPDPLDTVNGQVNHLKVEYEDAFVAYYAKVLAYLKQKNLDLPVYAALQNEPDAIVPWPGCVYPPDQWRRVMKKFRSALDKENLGSIKIHGTDHNHYTLTKYMGPELSDLESDPELLKSLDGIALHSYNEGKDSGGPIAVEARSEIVKFTKQLKPGSEFWITEFSTTITENLTDSAIHHLRSMVRDIGYLGANSYLYWLGSSDRDKFVGEELIYGSTKTVGGTKTKLYFIFKKLWNTVTPGEFYARPFVASTNEELASFGPNPMDMLGFTGKGKTVILLTNPMNETLGLTLKGVPGTEMQLFRTSDDEDMQPIGTRLVANGAVDVVLAGRSILLLESNGGL